MHISLYHAWASFILLQFELGQQVVCTMYNYYLIFDAALNDTGLSQNETDNYTSKKSQAQLVMDSACVWVCV